jgi:hypothetical protein
MTVKEVIEIVKESDLWESLTQEEKQEAINHAIKNNHLLKTEQDTTTAVDEVD